MCGQYAEPADAATAVYVKYTTSGGEIICQAVEGEAADGGDRVTVDGVVYTTVVDSALTPIAHTWIADAAEDGSVSTYTCQTCKTVATVIASMDGADNTKSHEKLPDGTLLEFTYTVPLPLPSMKTARRPTRWTLCWWPAATSTALL